MTANAYATIQKNIQNEKVFYFIQIIYFDYKNKKKRLNAI
jgi:hypothetical protein